MAVITLAGEALIASYLADPESVVLNVDQMIFAHIPGLDYTQVPDRAQGVPVSGNIKATLPITQKGKVNNNLVVYSTVMPSDLGTWLFNWMGLYSSADNTLVAVAYVPEQEKRATVAELLGNVLTKNIAMEFNGASAVTGITINAESWQMDYTSRLRDMDDIQRQAMLSVFGSASFQQQAFRVKYSGGQYWLNAGSAVAGGLNISMDSDLSIVPGTLPKTIWLDVSQQTTMAGIENVFSVVSNDGSLLNDYIDSGMQHHMIRLGTINSSSSIVDERGVIVDSLSRISMATENSRGLMLLAAAAEVLAGTGGTKAVTSAGLAAASSSENESNKFVKRDGNGDFSARIITATLNGNSSTATRLATARTIGGVSFDGSANISLPGVNQAGNQNTSGNAATATKLATARSITVAGAVDGSATFDGSANATITVGKKVGEFYIQFPGASAPSTLFGGTWSARFESEGIFFRTPGGNALGFNSGIQGDSFKSHSHDHTDTVGQNTSSGGEQMRQSDNSRFSNPTTKTTDSTGGIETRPRNRTFRVWELIAI